MPAVRTDFRQEDERDPIKFTSVARFAINSSSKVSIDWGNVPIDACLKSHRPGDHASWSIYSTSFQN